MKTIKNGMKLGKAKVIVDIVDKGNVEIRPETKMNPTQICIHNTGNSGKGADAKSHNKYIHNMANLKPAQTGYASWHFSVDDKYIYQHIPLDECAWHTGDGSGSTSGNRTAIGIEICENVDMADYHQAEENAIALAVYLMKLENISINKVKPHQAFSGKYCPRVILKRDKTFTKFHNRIKKAMGTAVVTSVQKGYLSKGDSGIEVKTLQGLLNSAGAKPKISEDGIFGAGTDEALRDFQKSASISVDGKAGEATMSKLKSATKEEKKQTSTTANKSDKLGKVIGTVKVLADNLNVRKEANFDSKVSRVVKKGTKLNVYSQKNGLYQVGDKEYCTSNKNMLNTLKNLL